MLVTGVAIGILAITPFLIVQQRRIAELRRKQRAAVDGEGRRPSMQALIEAIPFPVFYKGLDGRYLGCNSAFAEYIGRQCDEIVGRTVHDVVPTELAERYAATDAALLASTGAQVCDVQLQCATGFLRDVVMHKATFEKADGAVGGIIGVIMDVTERKCADHMLRQNEQKFRSLAEHIPVNVLRFDRQGRVLYMNPALMAALAPEVMPVVGKSPVEAHPGIEAAASHQRFVEQVIATGMSAEVDFPFPNARGEMRLHHIRHVAEHDGDGEIVGALAIGYDITDHKRSEAFEQFRSRTLELLSGGESLQDVLTGIVRGVQHLGGELDCSILLLDRRGEQRAMGVAATLPDCCTAAIDGIERGPGAGGWRLVAATGKPFAADDGESHSCGAPAEAVAARAESGACRSVPIRSSAGHLLGVFVGHCRDGYSPTEFDISIIGKSARLASLAIERRRFEEALRASEREFRNLAEHLPDYIARYDREGRWTYLNRRLAELLGVEARDVLGTPVRRCAGSDGDCAYLACLESVLRTGRPAEIDITWPDAGNGVRYHNIRFIPERGDDGEIVGALSIGRDVTERQQIQRQMEMQTAALKNSNDAVFVMDDTMRFVYVNETACRSLGYSYEELLTMAPIDIDPNVTPEIARAILARVKARMPSSSTESEIRHQAKEGYLERLQIDAWLSHSRDGGPPPSEFETLHRAKDGRIFPVEIFASTFRYEGRTFGVSVVREITERKRIEDAMRFIAQRGWEGEGNSFFEALVRYLGQSLGVDYALIARLDAARTGAETVAVYAKGAVVPNFHYDLPGTPCESVNGRGYCCHPRGVQALFPDDGLLVDMAAESYAGIPLWDSGGQPLGLIAVLGCQPIQNEGWVAQLLQLVAPRAAAELERARSDALLRAREQEFRTLAESLPDYIARYDREGRWVYLNRLLAELVGVEACDVLGSTARRCGGPDGNSAYLECLEKVLRTGQPAEIDIAWPDTGNGVRYHNIRFVPERGPDGEIVGALSIGRDVTDRQQIHRQMEIQTAALNNSNDALFLLDDNLRFVYVNETACRSLGYSREELLTMGPADIDPNFTPEIAQAIRTEVTCGVPPPPELEIRHRAKDGDTQPGQVNASLFELIDGVAPPADFETEHRTKDGRIFPVEICASSFQYEGRTFGLSVVRDITERRRYQETLSAREREFRSLAENAPDNIVRFDRQGRILYVNPRLESTLALAAADAVGKMPQEIVPTWDSAPVDAVLANGQPVETEFAVMDGDGNVLRQYQIRFVAERGAEGEIVGVLGIGRDVTRQKLAARDMLVLNSAINSASDGVLLVSQQFQILYVNDRACRTLGYSREQLLSMSTDDIITEVGWEKVTFIRDGLLARDSVVRTDIHARTADGRTFPIELSVSQVEYENEKLALVLARDVTERRRMEGALQRREEEFRSLADNLPDIVSRYDLQCRHIYANPAYLRELEVSVDKVLGYEPHAGYWRSSSLGLDEYKELLQRVISTGKPGERVFDWKRSQDGVAAEYAVRVVAERDVAGRVVGALCIGHNVTELMESERRLEESRSQLRELAARREDAREEERRHIAREIHDELGQQLSALRFKLGLLAYDFGGALPEIRSAVDNLMSLVGKAIQTTRHVSSALRPAVLDMGIVPALEWLVSEFAPHGGISFTMTAKPEEVRLDSACTVALFRIAQESLTNAVRHSLADRIEVAFGRDGDAYLLEVRDNGVGFEPSAPRDLRSIGLVGMRERALAVGGEWALRSALGQGTVLRVRIPLEAGKEKRA